jgi:peptidoglycan/LPS O-acetylase OafA/YrhL
MKLSAVAQGRDNNFNLIRFVAAFAVLVSHSFPLTTGLIDSEPMRVAYGLTWGDIAVDIFFITSGFLVTASLIARKSILAFLWARALRIVPALWVMLAFTIFGIGLGLSALGPQRYLGAHQTWKYAVENATLIRSIAYTLPGVFSSNPLHAVNGSLWSLRPEVDMYGALACLWIISALAKAKRVAALNCSIVALAAVSGIIYLGQGTFENPDDEFPGLIFMFFTGASFYVLKEHIELRWSVCLALLAIDLLCLMNRAALFIALSLSLAYLVFCAAYGVRGRIRAFNRFGDYSYGIYIYAFLVQQTIIALIPGLSALELIGIASVFTLILAMLSWHLIEKRALALKDACTAATIRILRLHSQMQRAM